MRKELTSDDDFLILFNVILAISLIIISIIPILLWRFINALSHNLSLDWVYVSSLFYLMWLITIILYIHIKQLKKISFVAIIWFKLNQIVSILLIIYYICNIFGFILSQID